MLLIDSVVVFRLCVWVWVMICVVSVDLLFFCRLLIVNIGIVVLLFSVLFSICLVNVLGNFFIWGIYVVVVM